MAGELPHTFKIEGDLEDGARIGDAVHEEPPVMTDSNKRRCWWRCSREGMAPFRPSRLKPAPNEDHPHSRDVLAKGRAQAIRGLPPLP